MQYSGIMHGRHATNPYVYPSGPAATRHDFTASRLAVNICVLFSQFTRDFRTNFHVSRVPFLRPSE